MLPIATKEFWQLTKNIKSIVMVLILLASSYYFSKNGRVFAAFLGYDSDNDAGIYATGLLIIIVFFGSLFTMALSHDVINREVSNRTIRFLLTRTSSEQIIWGKFLGTVAFWFACILLAVVIIAMTSQTFSGIILASVLCLITIEIAFAFVLSILISKPRMTMFLGIVFGTALPIMSQVVEYSDKWWGKLRYISPIHYSEQEDWQMILLPIAALLLIFSCIQVFKRGEY